MDGKDPATWAWTTWAMASLMALAGGAVNWWARMRLQHTKEFKLLEFLGEIFTAWFIGMGTIMILLSYEFPPGMAYGMGGVTGHMGLRLLFLVERAAEKRIQDAAGLTDLPYPENVKSKRKEGETEG